ncbi:MAG: hypothetical protein ACQESQ_09390 [Bacteroidota bacterium]
MKKLAVFKSFTKMLFIYFVLLIAIDLALEFIYFDFNLHNALSAVLTRHSIIITGIIAIALTTFFVMRKVRKENQEEKKGIVEK